jgi:hypothetical protein
LREGRDTEGGAGERGLTLGYDFIEFVSVLGGGSALALMIAGEICRRLGLPYEFVKCMGTLAMVMTCGLAITMTIVGAMFLAMTNPVV